MSLITPEYMCDNCGLKKDGSSTTMTSHRCRPGGWVDITFYNSSTGEDPVSRHLCRPCALTITGCHQVQVPDIYFVGKKKNAPLVDAVREGRRPRVFPV